MRSTAGLAVSIVFSPASSSAQAPSRWSRAAHGAFARRVRLRDG